MRVNSSTIKCERVLHSRRGAHGVQRQGQVGYQGMKCSVCQSVKLACCGGGYVTGIFLVGGAGVNDGISPGKLSLTI